MTTNLSQNNNQFDAPTRTFTLSYTHPGNENGNSISAGTGITLPDSYIEEGSLYKFDYSVYLSTEDNVHLAFTGNYAGPGAVLRPVGSGAVFLDINNNRLNANYPLNIFIYDFSDTLFKSDPQIKASFNFTDENIIIANIFGLSVNIPTVWKIKCALTPAGF